jgi:hypothetical protein
MYLTNYESSTSTEVFYVRFKFLRAASRKMTAFWDVAQLSLVEVDQRFRGAYCLYHQGGE